MAFLTQDKGEVVPWAPRCSPFPFKNPPLRAKVPCLQTRAGSHLTHCNGFQTKQQQENSMTFQKGNCCYQCPAHTHVPSSPPHPLPPGKESRGFCCQAAPGEPPSHSQIRTRQQSGGGTAPQSLVRHPRGGDLQEEPLRSRLPCKAECSGSAGADEDVQEWMGCGMGEVMRRG